MAPISSRTRNEEFFARSRKSRDCAETYMVKYVTQAIPQIDAELAKPGTHT
jgi:hypothetical protein